MGDPTARFSPPQGSRTPGLWKPQGPVRRLRAPSANTPPDQALATPRRDSQAASPAALRTAIQPATPLVCPATTIDSGSSNRRTTPPRALFHALATPRRDSQAANDDRFRVYSLVVRRFESCSLHWNRGATVGSDGCSSDARGAPAPCACTRNPGGAPRRKVFSCPTRPCLHGLVAALEQRSDRRERRLFQCRTRRASALCLH